MPILCILQLFLPKVTDIRLTALPVDSAALLEVIASIPATNYSMSERQVALLKKLQDALQPNATCPKDFLTRESDRVCALLNFLFRKPVHAADLHDLADKNATVDQGAQEQAGPYEQVNIPMEATTLLRVSIDATGIYSSDIVRKALILSSIVVYCVSTHGFLNSYEPRLKAAVNALYDEINGRAPVDNNLSELGTVNGDSEDGESVHHGGGGGGGGGTLSRAARAAMKKAAKEREKMQQENYKRLLTFAQNLLKTSKTGKKQTFMSIDKPSKWSLHLALGCDVDADELDGILNNWGCDGLLALFGEPVFLSERALARGVEIRSHPSYSDVDFVFDEKRIVANAEALPLSTSEPRFADTLMSMLIRTVLQSSKTAFTRTVNARILTDLDALSEVDIRPSLETVIKEVRDDLTSLGKAIIMVKTMLLPDGAAEIPDDEEPAAPPPTDAPSAVVVQSNALTQYRDHIIAGNRTTRYNQIKDGGGEQGEGCGAVTMEKYRHLLYWAMQYINEFTLMFVDLRRVLDADAVPLDGSSGYLAEFDALRRVLESLSSESAQLRTASLALTIRDMIALGKAKSTSTNFALFHQLVRETNRRAATLSCTKAIFPFPRCQVAPEFYAKARQNAHYLAMGCFSPTFLADLERKAAAGLFSNEKHFQREGHLVTGGGFGKSRAMKDALGPYDPDQQGRTTAGAILHGSDKGYGRTTVMDEGGSVRMNSNTQNAHGINSKTDKNTLEAAELQKTFHTYEKDGVMVSHMAKNNATGAMERVTNKLRPGFGTRFRAMNQPQSTKMTSEESRRVESYPILWSRGANDGVCTYDQRFLAEINDIRHAAVIVTELTAIVETAGLIKYTECSRSGLAEEELNIWHKDPGGGLPILSDPDYGSAITEMLGCNAHAIALGLSSTSSSIHAVVGNVAVMLAALKLPKQIITDRANHINGIAVTRSLHAVKALAANKERTAFLQQAATLTAANSGQFRARTTSWMASSLAVIGGMVTAGVLLLNTTKAISLTEKCLRELSSACTVLANVLSETNKEDLHAGKFDAECLALIKKLLASLAIEPCPDGTNELDKKHGPLSELFRKHLAYEVTEVHEGLIMSSKALHDITFQMVDVTGYFNSPETAAQGRALLKDIYNGLMEMAGIAEQYTEALRLERDDRDAVFQARVIRTMTLAEAAIVHPECRIAIIDDAKLPFDQQKIEAARKRTSQFEGKRATDIRNDQDIDVHAAPEGFRPNSMQVENIMPMSPSTLTFSTVNSFKTNFLGLTSFGRPQSGVTEHRDNVGDTNTDWLMSAEGRRNVDRDTVYINPHTNVLGTTGTWERLKFDSRNFITMLAESSSQNTMSVATDCCPPVATIFTWLGDVLRQIVRGMMVWCAVDKTPLALDDWSSKNPAFVLFHSKCRTWIRAFVSSDMDTALKNLDREIATLDGIFAGFKKDTTRRQKALAVESGNADEETVQSVRGLYRKIIEQHIQNLVLLPSSHEAGADARANNMHVRVGPLVHGYAGPANFNLLLRYALYAVTNAVSLRMHDHPLVSLLRYGGAKNGSQEVFRVQTQMVLAIEGYSPAYPDGLTKAVPVLYQERQVTMGAQQGHFQANTYQVMPPSVVMNPGQWTNFMAEFLHNKVDPPMTVTFLAGIGDYPTIDNPSTGEYDLDTVRMLRLIMNDKFPTLEIIGSSGPIEALKTEDTHVSEADADTRVSASSLIRGLLEQMNANRAAVAATAASEAIVDEMEKVKAALLEIRKSFRAAAASIDTTGTVPCKFLGRAYDEAFWKTQMQLAVDSPYRTIPNISYNSYLQRTKLAGLFSIGTKLLIDDVVEALPRIMAYLQETTRKPSPVAGEDPADPLTTERMYYRVFSSFIVDVVTAELAEHPLCKLKQHPAALTMPMLAAACVEMFSVNRPCATLLRAAHVRNLNVPFIAGRMVLAFAHLCNLQTTHEKLSSATAEVLLMGILAVCLPRGCSEPITYTLMSYSANPVLRALVSLNNIGHDKMCGYENFVVNHLNTLPAVRSAFERPKLLGDITSFAEIFAAAKPDVDLQHAFIVAAADTLAIAGIDGAAALQADLDEAARVEFVPAPAPDRECLWKRCWDSSVQLSGVFIPVELMILRMYSGSKDESAREWSKQYDAASVRSVNDRGLQPIITLPPGLKDTISDQYRFLDGYGPFCMSTATLARVIVHRDPPIMATPTPRPKDLIQPMAPPKARTRSRRIPCGVTVFLAASDQKRKRQDEDGDGDPSPKRRRPDDIAAPHATQASVIPIVEVPLPEPMQEHAVLVETDNVALANSLRPSEDNGAGVGS